MPIRKALPSARVETSKRSIRAISEAAASPNSTSAASQAAALPQKEVNFSSGDFRVSTAVFTSVMPLSPSQCCAAK